MNWKLVIRDGMPKPKPDDDSLYRYIGYWFDEGEYYTLFGVGWWDRDKPVWQATSGLPVTHITHWAELEPPK